MDEKKKYQIEATVDKFQFENRKVVIQFKGCGKYSFEKNKDNNKEYYNIIENIEDNDQPILIKQNTAIQITVSENEAEIQHLLNLAFIEKKKLKFDMEVEFDYESKPKQYTITGISHGSI